MEVMLGKRGRKGSSARGEAGEGLAEGKIAYDDFVGRRLPGLKAGTAAPYSAEDVKRMLLSKDFQDKLPEIKKFAKQYGRGELGAAEAAKLANFAANVNAIIKNDALFVPLSQDKALRRNWQLIKFAVGAAISGDVKDGFEAASKLLKPEERLTDKDREKLQAVVKEVFGAKVLQKKPLKEVFDLPE